MHAVAGPAEGVAELLYLLYLLCSERASYITGTEVHINGGQRVESGRGEGGRCEFCSRLYLG